MEKIVPWRKMLVENVRLSLKRYLCHTSGFFADMWKFLFTFQGKCFPTHCRWTFIFSCKLFFLFKASSNSVHKIGK